MIRKTAFLFFLGLLAAAHAPAASVLLTMLPAEVSVSEGITVTLGAQISNGFEYEVFLNGSSVNIMGSSFSYNDLFATLPLSLAEGQSVGPVDLLEVTASIPLFDPDGVYEGTYTLLGGADQFAQDVLATGTFSITLGEVPEPGTWWMLAGSAPVLMLLRRRSSHTRQTDREDTVG